MPNTDGKQGGRDQGNAIENETREADSRDAASRDRDAIEEIIRRNAKPEVTEEESTLAEEHRDGGEPSPWPSPKGRGDRRRRRYL